MRKKIDPGAYNPSWTEVILGAVLSGILGVVLGIVLLVLKPVQPVKELKEEDRVPGMVYFIEGSRLPGKSQQALVKRKAFAEGQAVTVIEDEINVLLGPATPLSGKPAEKEKAAQKAPTKAPTKAPANAPADQGMLVTGTPSVRIREGAMHVGVPITIGLIDHTVLVQATGRFEKDGDVFVYRPNDIHVGSCPMDKLPFLASYVRGKFLAANAIPEDIATAWRKLSSVSIEGDTLKLVP